MNPMIIYIMGVSGSGKTTIGRLLSTKTGIPFFDADDFHSEANKTKMHNGHPLTDDDRQDWLMNINDLAKEQSGQRGAIIACSALKEKYRSILLDGIESPVYWVLLEGSFDLIKERLTHRKDHFMPPSLLQSQFDIAEYPADAIVPDISQSPSRVVDYITAHLPKF